MADITGLLTRKIGPFPGWAWALGVGGVIFLLGPKLLKGGSSTVAASQPGAFDPQSFATGFAQGAQYQPSPAQGQPAPTSQAILPQPPPGVSQSPINTVHRPRDDSAPPGLGGASRNRSASIGSISVDPHAYFHPAMKQAPRFPHFVRAGVGGAPVAHAAAVHQLAHQAEIHPARLQALNSRPHRFVRVA